MYLFSPARCYIPWRLRTIRSQFWGPKELSTLPWWFLVTHSTYNSLCWWVTYSLPAPGPPFCNLRNDVCARVYEPQLLEALVGSQLFILSSHCFWWARSPMLDAIACTHAHTHTHKATSSPRELMIQCGVCAWGGVRVQCNKWFTGTRHCESPEERQMESVWWKIITQDVWLL